MTIARILQFLATKESKASVCMCVFQSWIALKLAAPRSCRGSAVYSEFSECFCGLFGQEDIRLLANKLYRVDSWLTFHHVWPCHLRPPFSFFSFTPLCMAYLPGLSFPLRDESEKKTLYIFILFSNSLST